VWLCNHRVPYGNGIWSAERWDPTYPTYAVPNQAYHDPDGAKYQLMLRYVREYNGAVRALALRWPAKFMVLKTEDLRSGSLRFCRRGRRNQESQAQHRHDEGWSTLS
jgi:hypothetical protein